jgi:DNA-binding NarL/FixJ family response regulator
MSSLLARTIGLSQEQRIDPDAAVALLRRRSELTNREARLVVLDYMGYTRERIAREQKVLPETLKCYWRRIYKKLNCQHLDDRREAVRAWVERMLRAEIEGGDSEEVS